MITTDNRGYTLIEVLTVVAIIGIVTVVAFSLAGGDKTARFGQDFDELAANLRDLQANARAAKDNREYGMCLRSDGWSSFAVQSDTTADPCATGYPEQIKPVNFEVASMSAAVSPSTDRVVFERVTGRTKDGSTATLTLTLDNPARTRTLRIETNGAIHEQ
ncbi:MAG TPA: GspH/FimT family pseudopilin [Patescibacteria group bacterium]|jgi:type II secretion system protein H